MSFSTAQETGRPVAIKDEGVTLVTNVGSIDFVGAGVTGTTIGSAVTETIPGVGGGASNFVVGETPSGAIDGVNLTYTLANTPAAGTLALYYGKRLKSGSTSTDDFTLSGGTITMNYPLTPGDVFYADYRY